jgi:hypothetical protein
MTTTEGAGAQFGFSFVRKQETTHILRFMLFANALFSLHELIRKL